MDVNHCQYGSLREIFFVEKRDTTKALGKKYLLQLRLVDSEAEHNFFQKIFFFFFSEMTKPAICLNQQINRFTDRARKDDRDRIPNEDTDRQTGVTRP